MRYYATVRIMKKSEENVIKIELPNKNDTSIDDNTRAYVKGIVSKLNLICYQILNIEQVKDNYSVFSRAKEAVLSLLV